MPTVTEDQLSRLQALNDGPLSECNTSDRAIMLITACLDDGINRGPEIIDTLVRLGFNQKHAGIMLSKHSGSKQAGNFWEKQDDGTYRLHPETSD